MLTLTMKEIKDLVEFAGLTLHPSCFPLDEEDLETEFTVCDCPAEGVKDDDGNVQHFHHIAYLSEYPEEGCCPLGDEVTPNVGGNRRAD